MRDQKWGLELELTGITRYDAARVMSDILGSPLRHEYGGYDKYTVQDSEGRKWTAMKDGSIKCQERLGGRIASASSDYSVEIVTPVCKYDDIETLQQIVRGLRKVGGFVNDSCGIHVHVDGSEQTPKSIRNIVNIVASKNELLYKALEIETNRMRFCKKLDANLIDQMNRFKPRTLKHIEDIWYNCLPDGSRTQHYHSSRYHFLNLHSFFNGNGTLEFRGFNSTLHAGKVKTAVQLCLAMCHQAKIQKSASRIVTQTDNPKYTFRTYLLRLGMIGDEFKTARQHLLEPLEGNSAWRDPAQAEKQKRRQAADAQEQESNEIQQPTDPAFEPDLSF